MALDKTDLEYIKNTIEWLDEHTVLIDNNRSNCEMLYNSVQNSLQALESAMAKVPDVSENTLPINIVRVLFYDIDKLAWEKIEQEYEQEDIESEDEIMQGEITTALEWYKQGIRDVLNAL